MPKNNFLNHQNSKREATAKEKQKKLVTSSDENFILIKAGSFMMGPDQDREITIEYNFYMSKYQVTFEEYDIFCEATGRETPNDFEQCDILGDGADREEPSHWGRGKRPVFYVSWDDAAKYCEWLSQKEGRTYRLPSEAEWEYAARAGTTTKWCFGDDKLELAQYAWFDKNSFDKGEEHKDYGTHPVGSKKPNPWGLYDIYGNVWEWCEDWYFKNYKKAPRDGSANEYGRQEFKVMRGGSWADPASDTHSSSRNRRYSEDDFGNDDIGFRLVLQGTSS